MYPAQQQQQRRQRRSSGGGSSSSAGGAVPPGGVRRSPSGRQLLDFDFPGDHQQQQQQQPDPAPIMPSANSPAAIVRAAKASLREPSRPFTPAEPARRLFSMDDFGSARPGSSHGIPSAAAYLEPEFRPLHSPSSPVPSAGTVLPPLGSPGSSRPSSSKGLRPGRGRDAASSSPSSSPCDSPRHQQQQQQQQQPLPSGRRPPTTPHGAPETARPLSSRGLQRSRSSNLSSGSIGATADQLFLGQEGNEGGGGGGGGAAGYGFGYGRGQEEGGDEEAAYLHRSLSLGSTSAAAGRPQGRALHVEVSEGVNRESWDERALSGMSLADLIGGQCLDVPLGLSSDEEGPDCLGPGSGDLWAAQDDGPLTGWDTEGQGGGPEAPFEQISQPRPGSSRGRGREPPRGPSWVQQQQHQEGDTDPAAAAAAPDEDEDLAAALRKKEGDASGLQEEADAREEVGAGGGDWGDLGVPPPEFSDAPVVPNKGGSGPVFTGGGSGPVFTEQPGTEEESEWSRLGVQETEPQHPPEAASARPRTPVHPASVVAEASAAPPAPAAPGSAAERPLTSRGRPGTARAGDPNRLDAAPGPDFMRLSFVGPPAGTKTIKEGVQVLDFPAEDDPVETDPYKKDRFLAWRCSLESALMQLSACLGGRDEVTGQLAGTAKHEELGRELDQLRAIISKGARSPDWTVWLRGPSSTVTDAESGEQSELRRVTLEHLACCMEASSPALLLRSGRLILRVANTPSARLSTAKAMYTVSKDTKNDRMFRTERMIPIVVDLIQTATRRASEVGLDTLIYAIGALKNVTAADAANQQAVAKAGGVEATSQLLEALVQLSQKAERRAAEQQQQQQQQEEGQQEESGDAESSSSSSRPQSRVSSSAAQAAVQATGLLRNLAVSSANTGAFASGGIVESAGAVLRHWGSQHGEVVLNLARVLAKLSLAPACAPAMAASPRLCEELLRVLNSRAEERAIVLRVAFVLGNLTTESMAAREMVGGIPGAIDVFVALLRMYLAEPSAPQSKQPSMRASREEVLVKVVRLLANLGMHPELGPLIACQSSVAGALRSLLNQHSLEDAEELVLNCTALATNLSFYDLPGNVLLHGDCEGTGEGEAGETTELLRCVTPLLLCDNEEAVVEAARVYGNFSRLPEVREFMLETRVVEALALLLDHPNLEVLYAVAGTLVNLASEPLYREALAGAGACNGLVDLLERCAAALVSPPDNQGDLQGQGADDSAGDGGGDVGDVSPLPETILDLAEVVCKAMCNISTSGQGAIWRADMVDCALGVAEELKHLQEGNEATEELRGVAGNLLETLRHVEILPPAAEDGNEDDRRRDQSSGATAGAAVSLGRDDLEPL